MDLIIGCLTLFCVVGWICRAVLYRWMVQEDSECWKVDYQDTLEKPATEDGTENDILRHLN